MLSRWTAVAADGGPAVRYDGPPSDPDDDHVQHEAPTEIPAQQREAGPIPPAEAVPTVSRHLLMVPSEIERSLFGHRACVGVPLPLAGLSPKVAVGRLRRNFGHLSQVAR